MHLHLAQLNVQLFAALLAVAFCDDEEEQTEAKKRKSIFAASIA